MIDYSVTVEAGDSVVTVLPKQVDGVDPLFLPSGTDLSNLVLSYSVSEGMNVSVVDDDAVDHPIESGVAFDLEDLDDGGDAAVYYKMRLSKNGV